MTVAVENLGFGYPGKPIGRGVSFDVGAGETVVLLGPNGSGKTTLFKTILGLLAPQEGAVAIANEPLARLSRRQIARKLGYVPQASAGFFPFTVLDTVLMGRTAHLGLFATPGKRDRAVAEEKLASLGIQGIKDEPYTQISGGQRQLVLIARALAQEAAFLIMDEPTASLDFGNQVRVLDQVRRLARAGIGVVLSTHDPDHAFVVGDRVAVIHEGRLYALGPPEEVVTADMLARVYGVDVEMHAIEVQVGDGRRVVKLSVPLSRPVTDLS